LAVGSSLLPWAPIKLAANPRPVKGLVGLDDGGVCSRDVKRRSGPPIPRPGTVVPSAELRRGGGGEGRPAVSIDGRPTARRNARRRAGDTAVAAPSDCVRPKPRPSILQGRTRRAGARSRRARVSAQPTVPDFLAATGPGVKSVSHPRSEARASGFAVPPAARRCGESSSGSGGGGSARGARAATDRRGGVVALELVDRYRRWRHVGVRIDCPGRRKGREGSGIAPGPPLPFSDPSHRRQGDESLPSR
jgi:hypothetical protein